MAFTKRERLIILITLGALCVLVLDRYVLSPLLDSRDDLTQRKEQLLSDHGRAQELLSRRSRMDQTWKEIIDGGLRDDATEAESQILRALGDWAS